MLKWFTQMAFPAPNHLRVDSHQALRRRSTDLGVPGRLLPAALRPDGLRGALDAVGFGGGVAEPRPWSTCSLRLGTGPGGAMTHV